MLKRILHSISNLLKYFRAPRVINMNDVARAAETGNVAEIKYFLRHYSIHCTFSNGETLLHKAARGGQKTVAEFLIKKSANVNAVSDQNGLSPLHCAVKAGNGEMVELLLNNGADINLKYSGRLTAGRTPLHFAAHDCKDRIVDLLLSRGADVSCVDSWGRTPLHWAAIENCTTVAHLLLAKGAEVNKRDNFRRHALSHASSDSSKEMVELLIRSGADVMQKDEDGYTALHWASSREIAEVLIANNASLKAASDKGLLPIHKACIEGKTEVVEFFIAKGESVEAENHTGRRPLHVAAMEGQTDVIRLLISQGALIDAKDHNRCTPLHYAVGNGQQGPADLLIEKGADVNARDTSGCTALHRAAFFGFKELVELLIRAGAPIETIKQEGKRLFFGVETPHFSRLFPDSKVYFCESHHLETFGLLQPKITTLLVTSYDCQFINTDELAAQWISQAKLDAKLQSRDLPKEIVHVFAEIRGYSISVRKPEGENEVWAEVRPEPKEQPTDWTFTIEEKGGCWLSYCTLREMNHHRYRRYIITVGKDGSIQEISKVTIFVLVFCQPCFE